MARQRSDEMTSVGANQRAAKVDLPEPVAPTSTTREKSGISSRDGVRRPHRANTAICVGAPSSGWASPMPEKAAR